MENAVDDLGAVPVGGIIGVCGSDLEYRRSFVDIKNISKLNYVKIIYMLRFAFILINALPQAYSDRGSTHMPLANSSDSSHASLTCTGLNSPVMSLSRPSLKASNAIAKCVGLGWWR